MTVPLAALASIIVLATPSNAAGRRERCEPVVSTEIDRLDVDPAIVGDTYIQVRNREDSRGDTRTTAILAWVDLETCVGKLVIELSPSCRVRQAYTTCTCILPGLRNF